LERLEKQLSQVKYFINVVHCKETIEKFVYKEILDNYENKNDCGFIS